jgi:hypothetical protein
MRIAAAILGLFILGGSAIAQDVQVAVQKPPHYIGEPVLVRIVARGLDESPQPVVEPESVPPELRVQLGAVSPRISSSMSIVRDSITGRQKVDQQKTVVWPLDLRVTARASGTYTLGPFLVKQGTKGLRAEAVTLTFNDVPLDEDMRIRLVLPPGPIYPDQRVPVTVEWWYAGDTDDISELRIYSPIFDQFTFAPDDPPARGASRLVIDTKEGQLLLAAEGRRETHAGKSYVVLTSKRTLIPDRNGEFALPPITATIQRVTRWERSRSGLFGDLLGSRQAAEVELGRALGEAKTLVVKPFPREGRPAGFAGAVGKGFSLNVVADRTVVRVGDPIRLTVTLRGEGNIENASLPNLSSGGLNPKQFRVPQEEMRGVFENGVKKFDVTVRVQSEGVSEIPPIAYAWFDPDEQVYQTAQSDPIALRVMPAKMIGSDDVVSSAKETISNGAADSTQVSLADTNPTSSDQSDDVLSLSGADLSIERDAGVLLRDRSNAWGGNALQLGLYAAGLAILAVALIDRKRQDIPADVVRRRRLLRQQRGQIEAASKKPRREAAEEIAAVMRQLIAEMPEAPREEADRLVAECESLVYAPRAQDTDTLNESLLRRASDIVDQFIKEAE